MPLPKLVWIEWYDSMSLNRWSQADDLGDHTLIRTVGWFMREGPTGITISSTYHDDENIGRPFIDPLSIPWGAIHSWGELAGVWKS